MIRIIRRGNTHLRCNGLLDYVYGVWWKCRACGKWIVK